MSYYIHQTPGRLRVRTPIVKEDAPMALYVRSLLVDLAGVESVIANVKTGSITMNYDVYKISPATLINVLGDAGFLPGIVGFPQPLPVRTYQTPQRALAVADAPLLSPTAKKLLGTVARMVLPLLAERAFGRPGRILVSSLL